MATRQSASVSHLVTSPDDRGVGALARNASSRSWEVRPVDLVIDIVVPKGEVADQRAKL